MVITEQNFIQERFNVSVKNKAIVQFFMVTGYKFYGKILGNDIFNYLVQITDAEGNPKELKTSLVFKSAISTIEIPFIPNIDLEEPKKNTQTHQNQQVQKNNNSQNKQKEAQNPKQNQGGAGKPNQNDYSQNKNTQKNGQQTNQSKEMNNYSKKPIPQQIKSLSNRIKQLEIKCFPNMYKTEKPSQEEIVSGISKADQVNNIVVKSTEENSNKEKKEMPSNEEASPSSSLDELMCIGEENNQNKEGAVENINFENTPKEVAGETVITDSTVETEEEKGKNNTENNGEEKKSAVELMKFLNL